MPVSETGLQWDLPPMRAINGGAEPWLTAEKGEPDCRRLAWKRTVRGTRSTA